MVLSRTLRHSGVAGSGFAIQIYRYRRGIRTCMPAADNCHIYTHLQQRRQDAERERRALPDCPSPLKLSHTVRSELGVQDGSKAVFG
jgi:hypothetical protein